MLLQTKLQILKSNLVEARRQLVEELFSTDSELHLRTILVLDELMYKLELAISLIQKPVVGLTPEEVAEQIEVIESEDYKLGSNS